MIDQFKQLVQVRQLEVDRIERDMLVVHQKIAQLDTQIQTCLDLIYNTQVPKQGSIAQILQAQYMINALRQQIKQHKLDRHGHEKQLQALQAQYTKAQIELEKVKHLRDEYQKQQDNHRQDLEDLEHDEMALQVF